MRKTIKLFGIIALIAAIGFSLAGCPTDGGGSGGGGGGGGGSDGGGAAFTGEKLEFSGQVYLENWNSSGTSVNYANFTGNMDIIDYYGGTGEIKNGKLNYTIESPSGDVINFQSEFWGYENVAASKPNIHGVVIDKLNVGNPAYRGLARRSYKISGNSDTLEEVTYVYVDDDVTITGTGKTESGTDFGYSYSMKTNNFSVSLKKGWNAVYIKTVGTDTSSSYTSNETLSLGNPALRWVLTTDEDDWDVGYGFSVMPASRKLLKSE